MKRFLVFSIVLCAIIVFTASYAHAQYTIPSSVFGSAAVNVESGEYRIQASAGEPMIGIKESAAYELNAGFWYVVDTTVPDLPLPDQVVLAYPEDGETVEVPDDAVEVEVGWHPSQPEVTNYRLDIARDVDFTDMVFTSDELADTFYVFMDPEDQQTYYWRVRAENETGWGAYSEVWSFTTFLVSVDEREIPTVYSLLQNFPNPFNPSTVIRYGLPERSAVKLEVYNTLGQRVATLVNAELEAGYHEVEWHSGRVASGVYFYRIEARSIDNTSNRFTRVRSMILLK